MSFFRTAVGCVLAFCGALPVCAATIIDTGVGSNGPSVYASQFEEQGWTQTQSYTDVSIQVALYSWTPGMMFSGTAYLTSIIGPQASVALDSAGYIGETASNAPETITLFSGLTLGPGSYYITLASPDNAGMQPGAIWVQCSTTPCSPITLASGVTLLSQNFASAANENGSFPPASKFSASAQPLNLTVTGTLVPINSPEPSSFAAVLAGLALAPILRRRRSGGR